jgi:hypothetical protein
MYPSSNLKVEGCGGKIKGRIGFLMQIYKRERKYKID